MMKIHILIVLFVLISVRLWAQDALAMAVPEEIKREVASTAKLPVFEFKVYTTESDLSAVSKDIIGEHVFGDKVSQKIYLLESKYTYEVQIVPGNPQTKTVVRKPVIYEAVKKIERYLKKSVKKGEISLETASNEFATVLDVANNVVTADTKSFEQAISETDNTDSLINLLTKRVNLVY